jgi:hypothetical protein
LANENRLAAEKQLDNEWTSFKVHKLFFFWDLGLLLYFFLLKPF